jgi:hypothetical protein
VRPPFRLGPTAAAAAGLFAFAGLPAAILIAALSQADVAWDFHHELYPQAELMLAGDNPYPGPGHDPATGTNLVWPPLAAYLVAPLTALPVGAADVVMAVSGLACLWTALWVVQVRDWRVYGVVVLWPPVYVELGLSHLTPVIALLTALAWRAQASQLRSGLLLGAAVALKLFAWPLGVWLVATGRRSAALVAALVAAGSVLLILPYTGLDEYADAVMDVGRTFDQDAYTVFGLLTQAGASDVLARTVTLLVSAALLWATWRQRSFTLAVATALVASPIVWLDYFALTAIPLAIARPRLSPVWFVPLAAVGLEGAGLEIGDVLGTLRAFAVFGAVLAVAYVAERDGRPAHLADGVDRVGKPAGLAAEPVRTRRA